MLPRIIHITLVFALGCSSGTEEGKSTSSPKTDLRFTSSSLEGLSADGEYQILDGIYRYKPGDHLYPRSSEVSGTADDQPRENLFKYSLDADGFPTTYAQELNGERVSEGTVAYDKKLFTLDEHVYYVENDTWSISHAAATEYLTFDDHGRRLNRFVTTYYPESTEIYSVVNYRYFAQQWTLPGTSVYRHYEDAVYFFAASTATHGLRSHAYRTVFTDDGMPAEWYWDEDGTGDYVLQGTYETTQGSDGRPIQVVHIDVETGETNSVTDYEYNDSDLISATTKTEQSEDDPETTVITRYEITWHPNPVGGPTNRYTTYTTVDGVPTDRWSELVWSKELYVLHTFDPSGEEVQTLTRSQETIELPDISLEADDGDSGAAP